MTPLEFIITLIVLFVAACVCMAIMLATVAVIAYVGFSIAFCFWPT